MTLLKIAHTGRDITADIHQVKYGAEDKYYRYVQDAEKTSDSVQEHDSGGPLLRFFSQ